MMIFSDFINLKSVCIDTKALSKTAVFFRLSQLLHSNHQALDINELFDAFWKREQLGSTAIGHGILLPHIRSRYIESVCGCFLKLKNPVDFEAEDKRPIDLILGLIAPQAQNTRHLRVLAEATKCFSVHEFREACRTAKDESSLYSVLSHGISPYLLRPQEAHDTL